MVVRIGFSHPGKRLVARRGRVMAAPAAVAEVVEVSADVEFVEELAIAVGCQMAAGAESVRSADTKLRSLVLLEMSRNTTRLPARGS